MAANVVWLRQARAELVDIAAYIALDSPRASDRLVRRVDAKTAALASHPRIGPRRDDLGSGLRMLPDGPYVIFYRTIPDDGEADVERVEIVRVIDGRRDLEHLFPRPPVGR